MSSTGCTKFMRRKVEGETKRQFDENSHGVWYECNRPGTKTGTVERPVTGTIDSSCKLL